MGNASGSSTVGTPSPSATPSHGTSGANGASRNPHNLARNSSGNTATRSSSQTNSNNNNNNTNNVGNGNNQLRARVPSFRQIWNATASRGRGLSATLMSNGNHNNSTSASGNNNLAAAAPASPSAASSGGGGGGALTNGTAPAPSRSAGSNGGVSNTGRGSDVRSSGNSDAGLPPPPSAASTSITSGVNNGRTSTHLQLSSNGMSDMWCYVKAKTRLHSSTRTIKKAAWFEARMGNEMRIGQRDDCTLQLEDDRCAPLNARLYVNPGGDAVMLKAEARMYRLIGMGLKPRTTLVPLVLGSVIKVGSVSLEVTALCTKEGEDFVERFGSELLAEHRSKSDNDPVARAKREADSKGSSTLSASGGGGAGGGGSELESDDEDDDNAAGNSPAQSQMHAAGGAAATKEEEEAPAEICYICWGGPEDPITAKELDAVRKKGERRSAAEKRAAETAGADAASGGAEKKPNPLIRNPCGKCSGSSRYVHLQCILTWIKSSGSGHCSICNGALPQHFSSPPPNIELKVVRHRRGQSWVGTRRFRYSFADKPQAVIGRDPDSDIRLGDRSVCGTHARITFDRTKKEFFIQDCASLTGTYIQLSDEMELALDETTYVKIGRTTLALTLSRRRNSIIRSYLPSLGGSR